jgi:hypothetical protein
MTDYHQGNVDAYHDGLLAKHLAEQDYEPPWFVVDYEGEGDDEELGGYLVVNDSGENDGDWYETEAQAQKYADILNKEAMEAGDDDFYIE